MFYSRIRGNANTGVEEVTEAEMGDENDKRIVGQTEQGVQYRNGYLSLLLYSTVQVYRTGYLSPELSVKPLPDSVFEKVKIKKC